VYSPPSCLCLMNFKLVQTQVFRIYRQASETPTRPNPPYLQQHSSPSRGDQASCPPHGPPRDNDAQTTQTPLAVCTEGIA
jgi:hypothetical protein